MAVYKQNNKWYCRGRINGERYHLLCQGAETKDKARELEDAYRYDIRLRQKGLAAKKEKKVTFFELLEMYQNYANIHNKDTAHIHSKIKSMKDYFHNKDIKTINTQDVENYIKHLKKTKNITDSTINRYISLLRKAFNIAIENNLISFNPCKPVKKLKEDNQKIRYLTQEEEKSLFRELPERLKPIIITALHTGLRRSNILYLKWDNVDFEYGFIEILKQDNKGHKVIRIPMSDTLRNVLLNIEHTSEYVFVNPETNKPYNNIHKAFKSACERAGINNFRFHDLRHTVATRLVINGVDIRTVQEIMAHSSIVTTQRYMHPTPESKLDAINILDKYK